MTELEHILGLFARPTPGEAKLVALADGVVAAAASARSSHLWLEFVRRDDSAAVFTQIEIGNDSDRMRTADPAVVRLFRQLLARLAMMGHEESGVEFRPYGGRLTFVRHPVAGPVRLDIEFGNSQATGYFLRITRTLAPEHSSANGRATHATQVESSAG